MPFMPYFTAHGVMNMSGKSPIIYRILRPILGVIFRVVMRPKVVGREYIPADGRVVVAGNHKKPFDIFMFALATKRCLHFLAKQEIFKGKLLNAFFTSAGVIPVDRSKKTARPLHIAEQYLNNDCAVTIFPEGTTNKTDAVMLPFKPGAVRMAKDTGSPIVPFTIKGEYKLRGPRPEIRFYPPFYVGEGTVAEETEKFRSFIYDRLCEPIGTSGE